MQFIFSSTSTSHSVNVSIENDDLFEIDVESFTGNLELVGTPERVSVDPAVTTVNIQDDDGMFF